MGEPTLPTGEDFWIFPCKTCATPSAHHLCKDCLKEAFYQPELSGDFRTSERAILELEDGIVCVRKKNWNFPGGHVAIDEGNFEPTTALTRELKEELNIDISTLDKYLLYTSTRNINWPATNIFYIDLRNVPDLVFRLLDRREGIKEIAVFKPTAKTFKKVRTLWGKESAPVSYPWYSYKLNQDIGRLFFTQQQKLSTSSYPFRPRVLNTKNIPNYDKPFFRRFENSYKNYKITTKTQFKGWKVKDVIAHTQKVWISTEDPTAKAYPIITTQIIGFSNILRFMNYHFQYSRI